MSFKLDKSQKQVLSSILQWHKQPKKQYLTFGGYAGTGKTTLLSAWRKVIKKLKPKAKIGFCAYTGKASRVLDATLQLHGSRFDKDSVSTIHSLIYAPMTDGSGRITGWKRKARLKTDLIVVDEASMVDEFIWQDLISFEIPILAVGDHGQLPPVNGTFNLMGKPDLRLEQIHRQARGNPIIKLSMMAREDGHVPLGIYGTARKLDRHDAITGQEVEEMLRSQNDDLLLLVGFNWSRNELNKQMRVYREIEGRQPKVGDRLICLKNNWEKGIYNGMTGKLQRIIPVTGDDGEVHWYEVEVAIDDSELMYSGKISAHQFNQPKTLSEYEGLSGKALGDLWDFGYALTVHKAQGSQAEKVLLFEERNKHMSDDDWRRWLYTGVTRAEEYLTIVGTN